MILILSARNIIGDLRIHDIHLAVGVHVAFFQWPFATIEPCGIGQRFVAGFDFDVLPVLQRSRVHNILQGCALIEGIATNRSNRFREI